jgi:hypothetical protein
MWKTFFKLLGVVSLPLTSLGCSLNPMSIDDPQLIAGLVPQAPGMADIVKSLRCEIETFLVANRVRGEIANNYLNILTGRNGSDKIDPNKDREAFLTALKKISDHASFDVDENQFGYLSIDFKNTHAFNASLPWDFKKIEKGGNSRDWHYGPGITDTRTSELTVPVAIRQDADFGPSDQLLHPGYNYKKDPEVNVMAIKVSKLFLERSPYDPADEDFYCYKSLSNSRIPNERQYRNTSKLDWQVLEYADVIIQGLVSNEPEYASYPNYVRITVGVQGTTLAKWLQDQAVAKRYKLGSPFASSTEAVNIGQYVYQMTLDVKPTFDFKYTLVSNALNPLIPDVNLTPEHAVAYVIYLNMKLSLGALSAKNGQSCIDHRANNKAPPDPLKQSPIYGCPEAPDPNAPKPPKTATLDDVLKALKEGGLDGKDSGIYLRQIIDLMKKNPR